MRRGRAVFSSPLKKSFYEATKHFFNGVLGRGALHPVENGAKLAHDTRDVTALESSHDVSLGVQEDDLRHVSRRLVASEERPVDIGVPRIGLQEDELVEQLPDPVVGEHTALQADAARSPGTAEVQENGSASLAGLSERDLATGEVVETGAAPG